ncbi:MAG TPA: hypothetical protein PLO94_07415 [Chitinophagales bacterium]|nr:hypothetical protein [Chitinophagales bacterium]
MKKIIFIVLLFVVIFTQEVKAVEKGDFHMNVTTNLGHHVYIGSDWNGNFKNAGVGFVPGVTMNMDYAVSPYFSFGGWFTFAGKKYKNDSLKYRYFGIGVRGNFHIYQLISEKGNAKLDADKFDLYIPLHIGGGFKLKDKVSGSPFGGGVIVGSGVGATYYFVDNIGVNLETGYNEASYAKIGLSFKF